MYAPGVPKRCIGAWGQSRMLSAGTSAALVIAAYSVKAAASRRTPYRHQLLLHIRYHNRLGATEELWNAGACSCLFGRLARWLPFKRRTCRFLFYIHGICMVID